MTQVEQDQLISGGLTLDPVWDQPIKLEKNTKIHWRVPNRCSAFCRSLPGVQTHQPGNSTFLLVKKRFKPPSLVQQQSENKLVTA